MKKLIFIFAFLLSIPVVSQIGKAKKTIDYTTIGKLTNPYKWVELKYVDLNDERNYVLTFRNLEYSEIEDISWLEFKANQKEIDYLYDTFYSMTIKSKGKSETIEVGNGVVTLKGKGNRFELYVNIKGEPLRHTWLNKGQVKKLFNKN